MDWNKHWSTVMLLLNATEASELSPRICMAVPVEIVALDNASPKSTLIMLAFFTLSNDSNGNWSKFTASWHFNVMPSMCMFFGCVASVIPDIGN
jgi:hypothetical protein